MQFNGIDDFGHEQSSDAVDYIGDEVTGAGLQMPEISITLGSGLKSFADRYTHPDNRVVIDYPEIPNFAKPKKHAAGHAGKLIIAPIKDGSPETMAIWAGRLHFYQQLLKRVEQEWVTITDPEVKKAAIGFYVAINRLMGIKDMLTSNAVGSSNPIHRVGDIVRISDHMMDPDDDFGVPEDERWFSEKNETDPKYDYQTEDYFYSQAQLYSDEIHRLAQEVARELGWELGTGILNWRKGRGYENPAYTQARTQLGATLFGMSTAPEAQKARTVGFSNKPGKRHFGSFALVSNVAQIDDTQELNHDEVGQVGEDNEGRFNPFMYELIQRRVADRAKQASLINKA